MFVSRDGWTWGEGGSQILVYPEGVGALCFEWGFTQTFPGNQDVAVK